MNTRQEISDYLENHPYASAEELSRLFSTTRANIQYHLKQMEQAGVITPVNIPKNKHDRGRPRSFYALSPREKPENMALLADVLLGLWIINAPEPALLKERLVDLSRQILSIQPVASSLTARLNRLVKELSAKNYQARWEAHAEGPQMVFRNCPYGQIIQNHPELCTMDAVILEKNLNASIQPKSLIRNTMVTVCRFLISPPREKTA